MTPDATPPALPAPRRRRRRTVPPKRKLQSLKQIDQRSVLARSARDLQAELAVALGGDLSPQQRLLVERASLLAAFCSSCEARWLITGDALDPSYPGAVSALRHVLAQLGIKRVPRPVVTLAEHIAQRYPRGAAQ